MLVSGVFAGVALIALVLAIYTKVSNVQPIFGQIQNLLLFAVALLLLALYVLLWEIAMRIIGRSGE